MANELIWHDHRVNEITDRWKAASTGTYAGTAHGGTYTHTSGTKRFPNAPSQLRVKYATRGPNDPAGPPGDKTFWQTRIDDGAFLARGPRNSADPQVGFTPAQLHTAGYVTTGDIAVAEEGNFSGFTSGYPSGTGRFSGGLHAHRNPGRVQTAIMTNDAITAGNPPANHLVRAAITSKVNHQIFGRNYGVLSNYWLPDAYDSRDGTRLLPHNHDFNAYYRILPGYDGPVSKFPTGYQAAALPSAASFAASGASWPLRLQGEDFWSFTASGRTSGPTNGTFPNGSWQGITCFFRAPNLLNLTKFNANHTTDPHVAATATVYPVARTSFNLYNNAGTNIGAWGWGPPASLGEDADQWIMLPQFDFFFSLSFRHAYIAKVPGQTGRQHKEYIGSFIEWSTEYAGSETATGNGPSEGPGCLDPTLNGLPHFEYQFLYSETDHFPHVPNMPNFQDVVFAVSGMEYQNGTAATLISARERGAESVEVYWEGPQTQHTSTPWPAPVAGGVTPADTNYIPGNNPWPPQVGEPEVVWSSVYGIGTSGGAGTGSTGSGGGGGPSDPPPSQPVTPIGLTRTGGGLNTNGTFTTGPLPAGRYLIALASKNAGDPALPAGATSVDDDQVDPVGASTVDRFLSWVLADIPAEGAVTFGTALSHFSWFCAQILDECSVGICFSSGDSPAGAWVLPAAAGWTQATARNDVHCAIQLLWHPELGEVLASPSVYMKSTGTTQSNTYEVAFDVAVTGVPSDPEPETATATDLLIRAKAVEYTTTTQTAQARANELAALTNQQVSYLAVMLNEAADQAIPPSSNSDLIAARDAMAALDPQVTAKRAEFTTARAAQNRALQELLALIGQV